MTTNHKLSFERAKRAVVKVGSNVLTQPQRGLTTLDLS